MIRAFQIAWALVRVPNLSHHLFAFPIFVSLFFVLGQLLATSIFIKGISVGPSGVQNRAILDKEMDGSSSVRLLLYGSEARRGDLRVCRWIPQGNGVTQEMSPSAECRAERLDVAIQVSNPQDFVTDEYVSLFQGQIDRLHICKHCAPDAIISVQDDGTVHTQSYSIWGVIVLSLTLLPRHISQAERFYDIQTARSLLGPISLLMPESGKLIEIGVANPAVAFTLNVVPLIIISLWLAVRAHAKVLDYFAQNNVLLPLVAATGKRAFYGALWSLTVARVACFLLAAIPLIYLGLGNIAGKNLYAEISVRGWYLIVWFMAVVPAVALSTLVASLADLKQRHSTLSALYRYIPVVVAFLGGLAWTSTFIFPSHAAGAARSLVTAIPVIGAAPVFIAPVTEPPLYSLVVHGGLSLGLVVWLLRLNMKWFAAHLEDV